MSNGSPQLDIDSQQNTVAKSSAHFGQYPEGAFPVLLSYAFRIFFFLVPAYLVISILLWGGIWSGLFSFQFTNSLIEWHVYEMLYGLAGAGIAGFILTALPEFFDQERPIVGRPLLVLVVLWLAGRASFWSIDGLGVIPVAVTHLTLMLWIVAIVWRPIFSDPLRRHIGLLLAIGLLTCLQIVYFVARLGWVAVDTLSVLKLSVGAFMILVLVVLRRVNTGVTNELFEQWGIDDVFFARPPRYNLAIFTIALFSGVEFVWPGNTVLGWLGLAAAAALFNILNDFLDTETPVLWKFPIWGLWCIILMMALGYFAIGIDYLWLEFYGVNHLRHFLLTGSLGLAYLMILYIVTRVHTGRQLEKDHWLTLAVGLILVATLVRTSIAFWPEYIVAGYGVSSLLWAGAFVVYLIRFAPLLLKPRADGLPG